MKICKWLIYARRSSRHNWYLNGITPTYQRANIQASHLLQDCKSDTEYNWTIKVVSVYHDANHHYEPAVSLPKDTQWHNLKMVCHETLQSQPDQVKYNG